MNKIVLGMNKFGQKIWLDENERIGQAIIKNGIYDDNAIYYIDKLLQSLPNPVCLDIGANIGNHALAMSRHGAMVYCFEPQTDIAALLEKTVLENQITNIRVFQAALSNQNETLTFYKNVEGYSGSSTFNANLSAKKALIQELACVVGDDILRQHNITHVDFIKIDVEGFEARSLLGLRDTISRSRPIIMMEWNNLVTRDEFKSYDLFATIFKDYRVKALLHNHHPYYWGSNWAAKLARFFYRKWVRKRRLLYRFDPELEYSNVLLFPAEKHTWVESL